MFNIKVTDSKSKYFNQILKGSLFYYDIKHTGKSDDLYIAKTKDGKQVQLLSSQVDEKYYHEQELEKVINELGAKIGDIVIILQGGSGSYSKGWNKEGEHIITDIDFTGHVTFDNKMATIFRPKVQVISS